MTQDEMVGVAKWAVDVAEEYRVPISTVTELYKAIRKSHSMEETKNIIEKGFIQGEGDRDVCGNFKKQQM